MRAIGKVLVWIFAAVASLPAVLPFGVGRSLVWLEDVAR